MRNSFNRTAIFGSLLASILSPIAHAANVPATVFFSADSLSPSSPIPALGDSMLMVLGLLISVIAIRVLRSRQDIHKLLGISILGGGLLVGGFGVDRSMAGADFVIDGGSCSGVNSQAFEAAGGNLSLQNSCPGALRILKYEGLACSHDNSCPVGTVLQNGETCSLPACVPG